MNWHVLSNWCSVNRHDRFPVDCAWVPIDPSGVGTIDTTLDEFAHIVAMPPRNKRGEPLVFRAGFISPQGLYILLSDSERLYWRPLTDFEWEVLSLWWEWYSIRHQDKGRKLVLIEEYLLACPPLTFTWFITDHGHQAQISARNCRVVERLEWRRLLHRGELTPLLDRMVQAWVLGPERPSFPKQGMNPDDFYEFIT